MIDSRRLERPRPGYILIVLSAVVVSWIGLGFVRAPGVARSYFARAHGSAAQLMGVEARLQPAIPPFWGVEIHGDVMEAGGARYPSAMMLWVEPVSGWVVVMGSG
jgi:hypothetical protein